MDPDHKSSLWKQRRKGSFRGVLMAILGMENLADKLVSAEMARSVDWTLELWLRDGNWCLRIQTTFIQTLQVLSFDFQFLLPDKLLYFVSPNSLCNCVTILPLCDFFFFYFFVIFCVFFAHNWFFLFVWVVVGPELNSNFFIILIKYNFLK